MTSEGERRSAVHIELGTDARPILVRWSVWWEGRRGGYDSYVLFTSQGPVLIDPEEPTPATVDALTQLFDEEPIATLLTNDMHERYAYDVRRRWSAPVWAPAEGLAAMDGKPDHTFGHGDTLPGGLRATKISGRFPGDSILAWIAPGGERVLFTGDAINGAICPDNPHNAEHPRAVTGLYLGAGPFYLQVSDPEALKESLRPLLTERIDLICGAHGAPYRGDGRAALERLLALDWPPLLQAGRFPYTE